MTHKVLFLGQFFEMEISMFLSILRSPEFEKTILALGLRVRYQHNSKRNFSGNFKFGVLHLYHMYMRLETFYKDWTKSLCTGGHKRILIH